MDDKIKKLVELGLTSKQSSQLINDINTLPATECWQKINAEFPFINSRCQLFTALYQLIYPDWEKTPAPAWFPSETLIEKTNLNKCMQKLNYKNYAEFHRWSYQHYADFWQFICEELNIYFSKPYTKIVDLTAGVEKPAWFPGAQINITQSCFNADPMALAIIYQAEHSHIKKMTYGELLRLTNRVANSLVKLEFKSGDAIAINMPMTPDCIAIYLGIIKAGCTVVSIADSFAPDEIATRLRITQAKAIFTQDYITRNNKQLPLYNKVVAANAPMAIVLAEQPALNLALRNNDLSWQDFLVAGPDFTAVDCQPGAAINILFSSGTTGDPKTIPWDHTTAIKCASDAYFHQDVQINDVIAWPTNLGWMMGPWLIFAGLVNRGTIALYDGTPNTRAFGEFIQNVKVNILGLVPSIVKSWRTSACMEGLDWRAIKLFSSTGECSNVEDMLYLMTLADNKPVIEYCGGAYITSTLMQAIAPAAFTTPTLGLNFMLLDEQGHAAESGEVALMPPSIGLSTTLLNKDHYAVYFADMPRAAAGEVLRRHGDHIQHFSNGFYRALGRVDDTMNLSGIKISAAEIERILLQSDLITEAAAVAITPNGGGPSELMIYAVPAVTQTAAPAVLKKALQKIINEHLNPLFKIHEVICLKALPRTASNKIMRRLLRDNYQQKRSL